MADQQQFFLKWNDFQSNMVTSFRHLRDEKSFTDVTLACEGQTCKAHKMVLSACSPYFKSLLEENPSKHPIIILKDVAYSHLQAILEFMYAGEVNVSQEQLPAFLKTADRLKVKGLAEAPQAIKRDLLKDMHYIQAIVPVILLLQLGRQAPRSDMESETITEAVIFLDIMTLVALSIAQRLCPETQTAYPTESRDFKIEASVYIEAYRLNYSFK
ncbi:hypothetical protein HHI36_002184 [Cryptolaemus montrouzieri]|uniref:BTB domain-containing protein n=1 Tax=Cryptolaemus montrouzieri TaxID=559131 RepID=A0ABD2PB52_9CUCU